MRFLNYIGRVESDVELGIKCGLKTLMVGTGVDTLADAERLGMVPDVFAKDGMEEIRKKLLED